MPLGADAALDNPKLPAVYLLSEPHPKDLLAAGKIISLCHPTMREVDPTITKRVENLIDAARPYAPWTTLSDFQYTETAVQGLLKPKFIDTQLKGMTGSWLRGQGDITLKDYHEYRRVLTQAHLSGVQFRKATVKATLWGVEKKYTFFYRDPWEWIRSLVTDPSLASVTTWKSRRMFYCENGHREQFIAEPWTADRWYEADTELPLPNPYPHCWVPLHIWLDKGLVTKHVKMFPIVARCLSLPSEIRNASGNGGGVFLGFMVMVKDPGNPKDRTDKENYEFAQFKREIYQQVLEIIFFFAVSAVLERQGFLIESLDFEEAWNFTCCRAGRAKFPCPRCLVSQEMLHFLQRTFEARTSSNMRAIVRLAQNAPNATQKEKILMEHGLHDVVHFMWNFRFSDPYQAVSYDLLHFDESGKWGHHLWPLILDLLGELRLLTEMTDIMNKFPRWRNLKYIDDLATKDFTDGQTHFDILKLLPYKCSLIHCTRTLLQFRMMGGLRGMIDSRIEVLQKLIGTYEYWCEHFIVHAVQDIRSKGVLRNATTRTGEGFHQEIAQHYNKTNFREAEGQIANEDEDQEAIARTRLIVDDFFRHLSGEDVDDNEATNQQNETAQFNQQSGRRIPKSKLPPASSDNQWIFGSVLRSGDSRSYQDLHAGGDPAYHSFDPRLRDFLHGQFPTEYLTAEDRIEVETFRCVYITFQSKDDWMECEDILRCNNNWYKKRPSDKPGLACARLRSLIRCKLPSGRITDIAIVQTMKRSSWRPRTVWDGCAVYDEEKDFSFLLMDYVIRGALLVPVLPSPPSRPHSRLHFFVDVVDGDMFLRSLNSTTHVCH
ncbi:hypothetical protein B0H14DRAFT_2586293 [Mycena olivaceomarginata]|nr:hypothetical protein B0H14DRAFT_2586293 [Mycena olivaceomarginata]